MLRSALVDDLRRAAAGQDLPPGALEVREHVERLMTDAAAEAFALERERLAVKHRHRDTLLRAAADPAYSADALELYDAEVLLQAQIDELRALTGALRRRFAV